MRLFNFLIIEYLFRKGESYFSRNMIDLTIQAYDKALKIDPKNHGIYLHKALALSRLGRYEEAMDTIRQAINLNPKNPVYPFFAGIINLDACNEIEALKYFENSIQLDNTYIFARQYLALALLKTKKIQEAIILFEKHGFPLDSGFKSRFLLIMSEVKHEIEDKELQILKKIISKSLVKKEKQFSIMNYIDEMQKDLKVQYKRAQKLYALGAFEKVVEICQTILLKNPNDPKIMKLQGEAYFSMGKYADSETCFKKVKGKLGNDPDVIFKLGISLYQQKKFDEGVEKLHEVLNLSKNVDEDSVAYWLGKSYLGKNQIGQAIYYLSRAFETIDHFFFEDEYSKIME